MNGTKLRLLYVVVILSSLVVGHARYFVIAVIPMKKNIKVFVVFLLVKLYYSNIANIFGNLNSLVVLKTYHKVSKT